MILVLIVDIFMLYLDERLTRVFVKIMERRFLEKLPDDRRIKVHWKRVTINCYFSFYLSFPAPNNAGDTLPPTFSGNPLLNSLYDND